MCSISNQLCEFQRYCIKEEDVVHTDGAKKCPKRNKQKQIAEEIAVEYAPLEQEKKAYGIVTLVTKSYIVYELDGNSICLRGKYNYAIGDKIEV